MYWTYLPSLSTLNASLWGNLNLSEQDFEAFANALLIVPKVLAENSGFDVQESIIKIEEEQENIVMNQDNRKKEARKSALRRVKERLGLDKEEKENYKK